MRGTAINASSTVLYYTIMNMKKTLSEIIRELLVSDHGPQNAADKNHIIAIYLFGSFAKNAARRQSDIDLAFIFNEKYYREDPFRSLQKAELLGVEIGQKIKKPVDVVVLNGASLSFTSQTIRNGLCLYESRTVDRILYEVAVQNKYEDFMPFIKELRDSKREKLLGRN